MEIKKGSVNLDSLNENFETGEDHMILPPYGFPKNNEKMIDQIINKNDVIERYSDSEFSYVKCKNITTFWIEDTGFSYMNNPEQSEDHFYLFLTHEGFNTDFWNEKVTQNKISTQLMLQFIDNLNTIINNGTEINSKRSGLLNKARLFLIFSVCFFLVAIMFFILLIMSLSDFQGDKFVVLMIGELISAMGFVILLLMGLRKMKKAEYILNKYIYMNYKIVEEFITKWNEEKFLSVGIYVIVPRNLKYIQFVLNKNVRFCLTNHKYPNDLSRKNK